MVLNSNNRTPLSLTFFAPLVLPVLAPPAARCSRRAPASAPARAGAAYPVLPCPRRRAGRCCRAGTLAPLHVAALPAGSQHLPWPAQPPASSCCLSCAPRRPEAPAPAACGGITGWEDGGEVSAGAGKEAPVLMPEGRGSVPGQLLLHPIPSPRCLNTPCILHQLVNNLALLCLPMLLPLPPASIPLYVPSPAACPAVLPAHPSGGSGDAGSAQRGGSKLCCSAVHRWVPHHAPAAAAPSARPACSSCSTATEGSSSPLRMVWRCWAAWGLLPWDERPRSQGKHKQPHTCVT